MKKFFKGLVVACALAVGCVGGVACAKQPEDPKQVAFRVHNNQIQWHYVDDENWLDLISLNTLKGENGLSGKSAYEIAVENGFEGSEQEWLELLVGKDGVNGKSAYEIAVENGFKGGEKEWLESLKGSSGENGSNGTNGKSAYEIAVENGFKGSEEDWLASLKGADGKSVYDVAVENGFCKVTRKDGVFAKGNDRTVYNCVFRFLLRFTANNGSILALHGCANDNAC